MDNKFGRAVISSMMVAAFASLLSAPSAYCEGLEAGSEAVNDNGFPVMTGPGATVLTPSGSYVVPGAKANIKTRTGADDALFKQQNHSIRGTVHSYNWNGKRAK